MILQYVTIKITTLGLEIIQAQKDLKKQNKKINPNSIKDQINKNRKQDNDYTETDYKTVSNYLESNLKIKEVN